MNRYVSTREQKVSTREQKIRLGVGCGGSIYPESDKYEMSNDPSWFGGNKKKDNSGQNNSWMGGSLVKKESIPRLAVVMNDSNNVEVNTDP